GSADAAAQSIATVERVARDALAEARALVAQTAAVPAEPAFEEAVARLVERFRAEAGLVIDLDGSPGVAQLDRETQVVLLRCLQEGLANVRKHAGATRVTVRVGTAGAAAVLVVSDDGRGFDVSRARSGFGLSGMADRAALADGELEVDSAPGRGTTLRVRLPIGEGSAA
ncbi:MAG: ATP-binding protein, partial [Microbacterium sp.]|uniref:sensor histidine kinase n=1 Tax=Microbacterium sp. TaxID=51671 RepID=UPI0039E45FD4